MAGLVTRLFKPEDTVNLWELLNEIKGWIDTLNASGVQARYWIGTLVGKSLADNRHTSIRMSTQTDATGGIAPTWDGDAFKLPAGRYRFDIQVRFDQASGGYRSLALLKNTGVTTYSSTSGPPGTYLRSAQVASSANDTTVFVSKTLAVAATDAFLLVARQTSGSTVPLVASSQDSELTITRIGD